jgi:bacteriorhodopsin
MEHNSPIDDRPFRIPPIVWVLGGGLIAALVAIFVFNVAVSTVVYYGFFLLMMGSHFFMHGSHGGHGGPSGHQHGSTSNTGESNKNEHSGHTGGCH